MSRARYLIGDSLTTLRGLPDASVDLVFTSPPFLALRSYLPVDHPDKAKEIGGEATPGEFIDALLDIVEECRRVLAPHGSMCVELGDTYSGSGGGGGDYLPGGLRYGQPGFVGSAAKARDEDEIRAAAAAAAHWRAKNGRRSRALDEEMGVLAPRPRPGPEGRDAVEGWPMDKSLCLIPESFRWALVYGRNPFTGRETPRWRARNVVRWHRPNPPVGALADKFRPATSDVVIACTSRTRYFDLDAVRTPHSEPERKFTHQDDPNPRHGWAATGQTDGFSQNPNGAPPLDTWIIPTEPYKGSHYATFPTQLVVRPVLAMCPERVCTICGEPSRRIVESLSTEEDRAARAAARSDERLGMGPSGRRHVEPAKVVPTGEWTDCGHDAWRRGVVLDPFAGSGTALAVATGHGRDAIGIDLDERNADLARERIGMFIEVENTREEVVA